MRGIRGREEGRGGEREGVGGRAVGEREGGSGKEGGRDGYIYVCRGRRGGGVNGSRGVCACVRVCVCEKELPGPDL